MIAGTQQSDPEPPYPSARYAWYVVAVLTFVYIFNFVDRQILSLLVGPIRRDLGISDSQMSLLMGFAFALFYTLFGIPMGRLADAYSRRTIIAIGFASWSLFTALCGVAKNFWQMALFRIGVGVGEASLSPCAYSLIADYFPPHRRATALGVYGMGIYLGSGLAYLLGGVVIGIALARETYTFPILGDVRPWQTIFFVVGLPGVLFALLLYTVREPVRRGVLRVQGVQPRHLPLGEVLQYLRTNWVTFVCHSFGFSFIAFTTYGAGAWNPTYFIRRFGWSPAEAGIWYGVIVMVAGAAGISFGGRFSDWLKERGYQDANMRTALYAILVNIPFGIGVYLTSSDKWMIALLIPATFLTSVPFGVAPAAIQQMMPNQMRGQASSIYLFINNLVGLGLGPSAVALTTDYIFRDDKMVGMSLLWVTLLGKAIAIILLSSGLKPYLSSLERLKQYTGSSE